MSVQQIPGPGRVVALEAKLSAPSRQPETVERSTLLETLLSDTGASLAVLIAPAGYGKTILLGQWAARDPRPFVWLQFDEFDNDPVVLLANLIAALDPLVRLDPSVGQSLTGPAPPIERVVLPSLMNALAAAQPFVLVLDDFEAVTSEQCWSVVGYVLRHLPQGCQVAMASRHEPPVPTGRLRVQGRLLEIGGSELRLDEDEARALLAANGVSIGTKALRELQARTEGWPAATYLAAVYLRDRADPAAAVSRFRGAGREFSAYLAEEVAGSLDRATLRFLCRTSILELLTPSLCDAVTGRRGSARVLEELAGASLFVVPLEVRAGWYRYHALFREWLAAQLRRRYPDAIPELHRRAAAWYEARDMPSEAIQHLLAAGNVERAGRLVASWFRAYSDTGRLLTAVRWVGWFTEEQIHGYPPLAWAGAWLAALTGDQDLARSRLLAAQAGDPAGPAPDGGASFGSAVRLLRAALAVGGVSAMLDDAEAALAEERVARTTWHSASALAVGVARLLLDGPHEAEPFLQEAADVGRGGRSIAEMVALGVLAYIAAVETRWSDADRHAAAAINVLREYHLEDATISVFPHAVRSLVLSHRGDLTDAQAEFDEARRWRDGLWTIPTLAILARVVLAKAALALGDVGDARAMSREARTLAAKLPDPGRLPEMIEDVDARVRVSKWVLEPFTASELRVLRMLDSPHPQTQIANELYLSRNTVKTHAQSIYRKLGVSNRGDAVDRARSLGILEP